MRINQKGKNEQGSSAGSLLPARVSCEASSDITGSGDHHIYQMNEDKVR